MACGLSMLAGFALPLSVQAAPSASNELERGRRIYQEGILPSGAPLKAVRLDKVKAEGAQAACASCHRPSGMGSVEGDIQVQPINGTFLFAQPGDKALATMDLRGEKRMNLAHAPYTDESLAKAIREGVNNSGRAMGPLMPRYALGKPEMQDLIAYLKQLSAQWSPGVSADTLHFATVIAPGVAPERRKALVDTMTMAFTQKNASTVAGAKGGRRHMVSAAEMVLGTERKWQLHVWELQGAPETWGSQLAGNYQRQPVFALLSGLSDTTWEPVHDFCGREHVPCLFPSLPLPPAAESFYSVYFSRGVALEADVLARHLRDQGAKKPKRLVQVYRDDYVGRGAAQALKRALGGSGVSVEDRILPDANPEALQEAVKGVAAADALMFWLSPAELAKLEKLAPAPSATVYFSSELAGGEHGPFPAAWKAHAKLVYPYDLPDKRQDNMTKFHAWLNLRKLAVVDEPLQAEAFFAVNFLTDTVAEMLDNLYRDYLLERTESMISRGEGMKSEQQAREREMRGKTHILLSKHESTTIYPRLSLGVGQRFASKGGYIVRFGEDGKLIAESDWIVP
jgi:mono/diheme cytochrome c family protein